jgi:hypothetical protein
MLMVKRSLTIFAIVLPLCSPPMFAAATLEDQVSQIFVGRSFTIRGFYHGGHLRYGPDGKLQEKADPGYWSRDGMVQFSAVKLSKENVLIMQGNRYCIQFEPEHREFVNVRTGDKLEIYIQLRSDQLSRK